MEKDSLDILFTFSLIDYAKYQSSITTQNTQ